MEVIRVMKAQIPFDTLLAIAREEGCTLTDKTTCVMVTKGSNTNNRLYVARTRDVSRINVNGCKIPDAEIAMTPPGGPVGTFVQVIRFDCSNAQALEHFRLACRSLDTWPSIPKKPRGRPAGGFKNSKKQEPQGPTVEVKAEETPAQHLERLVKELEQKKAMAAKIGFPLSKKTIAAFEEKIAKLRTEAS